MLSDFLHAFEYLSRIYLRAKPKPIFENLHKSHFYIFIFVFIIIQTNWKAIFIESIFLQYIFRNFDIYLTLFSESIFFNKLIVFWTAYSLINLMVNNFHRF